MKPALLFLAALLPLSAQLTIDLDRLSSKAKETADITLDINATPSPTNATAIR